ncbi:type VII secretion integral membrane protein EccD [Mycobacterium paragordonae]|uniref:type VII secretion integral membrane protein EccD n=1 Tax=Mycobacterium paragordonae TaxID=1389713 RepID=UPI0007EFD307|nr:MULTISPECIES: type VII secretion integral membrane protein EccD [Mycobacterium]OBK60044.1 type VII secretion integral membrane protein EccD [Mycobacterium gordonae]TDK98796.1 type VII secretion integral membrane protein EccD [Mycobacterium paragordonae]TDL09119.1 type VII secretion integral membrane protein EccD [Mycobacterium paragordonae]
MPTTDPELHRVTVHAGSASVDLTLPASVPVAELIPSIADAIGGVTPGTRYHLARLGASPLPHSTTLRQSGIRDGTALVLSPQPPAPPAVRYDDDVQAVSAALGRPPRSRRRLIAALAAACFTAAGAFAVIRSVGGSLGRADTAAAAAGTAAVTALIVAVVILRIRRDPIAGLTLSLIATTSAALAGLLAVRGNPGAPNVLLAAMAAGATAVLAIRVIRCGVVILAATACSAAIAAVAALASIVTGAPSHAVGSVTALACLGLIEAAPWLSIRSAGLVPGIDGDDQRPESELAARAVRTDSRLTSLRAGFAAAAAIAAVTAALAAQRAIGLGAVTGAVLLLHTRTDRPRQLPFAIIGISTLATTLVIATAHLPQQAPWIAALASAAAAAAIYLGFVAPAVTPVTRRGVHAVGCVALALVAPLTCWTCGAFGAVRGLGPLRT